MKGSELAPPRARGSTFIVKPLQVKLRGSPACAGIDRSRLPIPTSGNRLPRVRGDRPEAEIWADERTWAPPRARGSTEGKSSPFPLSGGSPACAGIDLFSAGMPLLDIRLPRVRGDRPLKGALRPVAFLAPPRARGSTAEIFHRRGDTQGSPACAGIDLVEC